MYRIFMLGNITFTLKIAEKGVVNDMSICGITSEDLYMFHQGTLFRSYMTLGAHPMELGGEWGVRFAVWAPRAREVRVAGSFNGWNGQGCRMGRISECGVWELFVPGVGTGDLYKYEIHTHDGRIVLKSDPYAFFSEVRPLTASVVYPLTGYEWGDGEWQHRLRKPPREPQPMNIYEVHLGTWKDNGRGEPLSYRELAEQLSEYAVTMGYTHLELLPVTEHPYDRSWGYQSTGFYSATSRFGTPHDFMYFVDVCHRKGLGVILDWVPGHFCRDDHGLRRFDGSPQYEYEDESKADKPGWGTLGFDLGKPEVQSFLISNALFWLDLFHIDGFRVDAVASIMYLDFCRQPGEWTPNVHGGNENLEGVAFLQKLNSTVARYYPHALMMAEDSSDRPLITAPVSSGGLGFTHKWNMGWMNDMLRYMELDPIYRKHHHNLLTFSLMYAFSERFTLPFSHDEVVHGKKSLINKMPGDYWQKFAGLRMLLGYMMAHPGKKLLFMGGEFGQFDEWKDLSFLDWHLLEYDMHRAMHHYVRELNHSYLGLAPFWQLDDHGDGFEWIDPHDHNQSVVSFMRTGVDPGEYVIAVCNFTPMAYGRYRIGVPAGGLYREVFNSDEARYGGSGTGNPEPLRAQAVPWHNRPWSVELALPPLAVLYIRPVEGNLEGNSGNNEPNL